MPICDLIYTLLICIYLWKINNQKLSLRLRWFTEEQTIFLAVAISENYTVSNSLKNTIRIVRVVHNLAYSPIEEKWMYGSRADRWREGERGYKKNTLPFIGRDSEKV